ncbi:MAG: 50S ribosomal protein L2 [Candidatus Diapherotrites archaeon]|uniref:50S ribosomal protein L2 n=1 Tax=Candidatus Iainarchaeum sp. TaxID=3101447 RepID=A0A8T3YJ99_9ARCH|nr:50S ribosomal protein L2 [Candidatus Diapherotrites archaeon]
MGKRLKTQRRGAGSPIYAATKNGAAEARYVNYAQSAEAAIKGEVVELMNDPARSAVLARVVYDNGQEEHRIAAEGEYVGQRVQHGKGAVIQIGNVLAIGECIEGCPIFNIERTPGDGGSLVRSSGMYALIMTKDNDSVYVKMPSGQIIQLQAESRATIGCSGAGGRKDKPFVKAGKRHFAMKGKHKKYPYPRAIAMNAVNHPFGGANHHPGKSKSTSRHAAPGRKVGDIASSRTGRRKKG